MTLPFAAQGLLAMRLMLIWLLSVGNLTELMTLRVDVDQPAKHAPTHGRGRRKTLIFS
jgi:hypothetical protein